MDILERLSVKPFSIVGHRGAAGVKPENTISSIDYAIKNGADVVEIDVRRTKDNKIILLHDPDFKRLTGRSISPRDVDYNFIRKNITIEGEHVPTLDEVLSFVNGKVGVFIEIKEPETVDDVLAIVLRHNALKWIAVISFYDRAIKTAKELLPSLTTGLIYLKPPGRIKEAYELGAKIVIPYHKLATQKANNFAHKLGLKIVAWTINSEKLVEEMIEKGADAFATDYPDRLARFRELLKS